MALRQLRTAETLYISDTVADDVLVPPTADAVNASISTGAKATVFDKILMSANSKTYEVTIDANGALKVTEQASGD